MSLESDNLALVQRHLRDIEAESIRLRKALKRIVRTHASVERLKQIARDALESKEEM